MRDISEISAIGPKAHAKSRSIIEDYYEKNGTIKRSFKNREKF